MRSHRERELKFDVDDQFTLPALGGLADESTSLERRTVEITSTYYDTDDRTLLGGGLTLRRRAGEVDAGWQLKVPTKSARTEISLPPEVGAEVPERLRGLLVGVLRGRPLRQVAEIRTERGLHRLLKDHWLLIEIADDRVQGTALGEHAVTTTWREVETELGPAGGEPLLHRAAELLTDAGATPGKVASKLARTLEVPPSEPPTDARSVVHDYAHQQWIAIVAGDIALRRGLDSVHKSRVAVRRFRSMLRVLRSVLNTEHHADLDAELSWYQDLLGEVRDRQVQRARLAERVAALPAEDVLGPVAGYIQGTLLAEQAVRRDELGSALTSPRYLALLDAVSAWVAQPPVPAELDDEKLRRLAHKAASKARKRLSAALEVDDPEMLHRARKAAKRARYATELAGPVMGKQHKGRVKQFKRVQDVLGEHQDSVIAAQLLRRLGTGSAANSELNGFTLGLLYEIEQTATGEAREAAARLEL